MKEEGQKALFISQGGTGETVPRYFKLKHGYTMKESEERAAKEKAKAENRENGVRQKRESKKVEK